MTTQPLMPPVELILTNGIGHEAHTDVHNLFDKYGSGMTSEIIHDCGLKSDDHVLDVGCGLGRVARHFVRFLSPQGRFIGIDVCKSSIEWCSEHYRHLPNFQFHHADVFNTHYNKAAKTRACEYTFPIQTGSVDCVFSTSLFTHLLPADAMRYLSEISRVLKPGGKTRNSFFLIDAVSGPLAAASHMQFAIEHGRVALADDPEAAIGLDTNFILAAHRKAALSVDDVRNGPWSGRTDNVRTLSQDLIHATRA